MDKFHRRDYLQAFATIPRERFLREGPWRIRSEIVHDYWSTEDADPIHLYHDVLVAIDESRRLDTGLPSLWAHLYDILDIKENERVVQIGCGLGYYYRHLVGSGRSGRERWLPSIAKRHSSSGPEIEPSTNTEMSK